MSLIEWMKTFEEVSKDEQTFVMVFGNKTDIARESSELELIKKQAAKVYPKIRDAIEMEGSAKTGLNIHQIFQEILQNFEERCPHLKISSAKSIG